MRSVRATDTERTNGANDEMGIDSFHVAQCALSALTAFLHTKYKNNLLFAVQI